MTAHAVSSNLFEYSRRLVTLPAPIGRLFFIRHE